MKKTRLLLGIVAASAVSAGVYFTNTAEEITERGYFSKDLNKVEENGKISTWQKARDYYDLLYMNPITGEVNPDDMAAIHQNFLSMNFAKDASLSFYEEGPDNVGGRTRAIVVDPTNDAIIYAGAVDGGLFKSEDYGNTWNRLQGWDDSQMALSTQAGSMSIASVCITGNGTVYVGTGAETFEGSLTFHGSGTQDGNGIWASTDAGATFAQVSVTSSFGINKVVSDQSHTDRVITVDLT